MNTRTRYLGLGMALLMAAMIYWGIRADQRLERLETRQRAPTAAPLQKLNGSLPGVASRGTVYVPVYSHIYAAGGVDHLLEVTLSVRNTDPENPLVIDSIAYYDTEGQLVQQYLAQSVLLGPLASTDFLVEHRDESGGSGANFLVDWTAESIIEEPVIEAVMVSVVGSRAFSFVRPGFPLSRHQTESATADPAE